MHRIIDPPKDQWDLLPTPLTAGERQVAQLFDAKLPSEWEMYVQPHLNGLRPDLVLLNPFAGIAVFEIKDWTLATLQNAVRRSSVKHPIRQIKLYEEEIYELYCPRLNERYGKAAITAGLIFTKIPQEEVNRILFPARSEGMRTNLDLYPFSGSETVSEGNVRALFPEYRRWGKRRPSEIMSSDTAADIRGWLQEPGFSRDQRKPIRLNLDQTEIARVPPPPASGYRRVKGPAGSGKSLALAARAAELASQEKQVLVCTFNITLVNYLRDLVSRYIRTVIGQRKTRRKVVRRQIDFRHFHGWCKWVCIDAGLEEEYSSLWTQFQPDEVLNTHMANLVTQIYSDPGMREKLSKYDAVLVDEGQDYRLDWWQTLRKAVKPKGEMLLVADKTQNVYGTAQSWTEKAMTGAGFSGPWKELKDSYRLPTKLTPILKAYSDEFLLPSGADVDLPVPKQRELEFEAPPDLRWVQVCSLDSLTDVSFEEVRRHMQFLQEDTAIPDIIFLVQDNDQGLKFVERCNQHNINVRHTFGMDDISDHGVDGIRKNVDSRRRKLSFFLGDARIKATTLLSFKGWEARHLVVQINRIESSEDRALFYTALTRLKKHRNGGKLTVVSSSQDLSNFGRLNFPDYCLR